jgi:hypothetical protein
MMMMMIQRRIHLSFLIFKPAVETPMNEVVTLPLLRRHLHESSSKMMKMTLDHLAV